MSEPKIHYYGWLTDRMIDHLGYFGLVDINNNTWCIYCIVKIHPAGWADVQLLTKKQCSDWEIAGRNDFGSLRYAHDEDRITASINLNHIVAAYEMASK